LSNSSPWRTRKTRPSWINLDIVTNSRKHVRTWRKNGADQMKNSQLATLKFFALLFLLPGLAGLIVSATISTHYLDVMPRGPVLTEERIVPREIHGIVVYQTAEENSKLNLIEYSSVAVFLVGLGWVSFISKNGQCAGTRRRRGQRAAKSQS